MTTSWYPGQGEIGTANQRQARRAQLRRAAIEEAERQAQIRGHSIKCGERGHHAGDQQYDGCKNDGSTCICECHDPKRGQA